MPIAQSEGMTAAITARVTQQTATPVLTNLSRRVSARRAPLPTITAAARREIATQKPSVDARLLISLTPDCSALSQLRTGGTSCLFRLPWPKLDDQV